MKQIYEKLSKVQNELKAPKGQFNSFGKYKYRSCEDILEAVKPILEKNKALVILSDEIVVMGTDKQTGEVFTQESPRAYVKATATFIDIETGEKETATAFAREELSKKGMDGSQISGASSSYARKYALNGLFNIDDTKDSDFTNGLNEDKKENKEKILENDEPKDLVCKECGATITEKVAKYSKSKYGKELCFNCQTKNKEIEI